ncbi:MAG TPA: DUF2306 domain-containing protein [Caulobacteraceae bacterium]|jgi:uncharacterized membrane protein
MSTMRTPAAKSTTSLRARPLAGVLAASAVALGVVLLGMVLTSGGEPLSIGGAAFAPHAPDFALLLRQPTVIQIHVLAALAAVALGAVLMSLRKGRRFHRTAGWTWAGLMGLTAFSSLFITGLNGDKWSLIHLLAGWTIVSLPFAVMAARRHKVKQHRSAMMGLFYGGVLLAGAFAFIPGRLMWELVLG